MFFGIGLSGLLVAALSARIGSAVMQGSLFGVGGLAGVMIGIIIGYPLGLIIGIIVIKKIFRFNGSILFGALGCISGTVLTFVLAEPLNLNITPTLLFSVLFVSSVALCTTGFLLRRKN